MVFIVTPIFTRQVQELLSDEVYAAFQCLTAAEKKTLRALNQDW
jgi:hypothetical protein